MWKLFPQKIKNEYKDLVEIYVKNGQWEKIKKEYFDKFIKGEHISWQQWLILLAVERSLISQASKKISIVSGHGIGKDASLSWLIIWYLFCHLNAQVGATAPTSEQIHDVLWKEIKIWLDRMPVEISSLYEWQSGYLRIKQKPETWFARARTARKETPEAIAGLHGDYVMIAGDEASGIPDEIFQSAEGSLTGFNTLVVLIGNGLRNIGYFYDSHHVDKEHWQTLQFDSEDSPLVDRSQVERMELKYGRESDEFRIRVKGLFPSSEMMDEQGWIPLLIDRQINQVSDGIPFIGRKILGIDPSGEGDDTTRWVLRDNFQARVIATEITSNSKTIARKTCDLIKEFEVKPEDVIIDNFGVGANVASEILLLDYKYHVTAVNWSEKAYDEVVYLNKRAECCFRGKDWIMKGGAVVGDEIKRDIVSFFYKNTLSGKKQIMDKPKLKQRLGRSPDRGDAFFLTFYEQIDLKQLSQEVIITNIERDRYSAI